MPTVRDGRRAAVLLLGLGFALLAYTPAADAHPVPRRNHDRTLIVRLTADRVIVEYRLEVDDWTVVFVDLPAVGDQVDLTRLTKPREFYEAFTRCYGPILADNLNATLDGQPLTFTCTKHGHQVLDHLQCDFVFEARWDPRPGERHRFTFRDGNYEFEPGLIQVALTGSSTTRLVAKSEADGALKAKALTEWRPGDEEKLRQASAIFEVGPEEAAESEPAITPPQRSGGSHSSLLRLLDSDLGFWLLLGLAAVFGAAHALTPGHGKTLVAAYLVGERGTVWHAVFLGLVTTLTHTGTVIALAALLLVVRLEPATMEFALKLIGGLLIAGLGLWLLMRRLSGGADHFHLGGHNHHHHHHDHHAANHYHDEHGHIVPVARNTEDVGWWRLVVLGITGGIVPCWDAIILLGLAISTARLGLALPLLLAFSAGLASVLVAVGILVVYARGFADSRWGEGRLVRALPVISAVLVTGIGLWLCCDSVLSKGS
jgi:ABC-type nickel/cobalt efflux system permease component RcnA